MTGGGSRLGSPDIAAAAAEGASPAVHGRGPFATDTLEALVRKRVSAALVDTSVRYAEERRRLLDALRNAASREAALHALLDGSAEALLVVDEAGNAQHLNAAARRLLGPCGGVGLPPPLPGPWSPGQQDEVCVVDAQGSERRLELRVSAAEWDGRPARLLALRDPMACRAVEQAPPSVTHDALTGLPDRALLLDRLRQALAMSARHARVPALLCVDLDQFKAINDTLGRDAGDEVLRAVAQRLGGALRQGDTLARVGGDEFLVLLPDLAQPQDAAMVARKLIEATATPYEVGGRLLYCSCSIGVAHATSPATDALQLIQRADLAMHEAKRAGRNNVQCYADDLAQRVCEQLEVRTQLQAALARREFALAYQPQLDVATQRICGVEALLRWRHPTLGPMAPGRFIPVAEETGQIVSIGEWVLDEACRQHRAWLDGGLLDCPVAVNVSGIQFRREGFVEMVETTLARHGLPGSRLELELTESVTMNPGDATLATLARLRALGVCLSIDDFGTGFSSLAYLKRLPITKVKIDRSFVDDITHDSHDASIVLSVIAIAHHLRLRVVAEGVETPAQLAYLRRHLCDEVQGFLIAQPLAAAELERFLGDYRPPRHLGSSDDGGAPTLLLVDDEPNILRALTRTLRRDGYRILTAGSAREAFERLAENEVQVIVSDQRMPAMCGTDFLSEVKSLHPDTVRLVLSGYTDLATVTEAINRGAIYRFLTKPWVDEQLRAHVREAFVHQQQLRSAA